MSEDASRSLIREMLEGKLSRREFMRRAALLGISATALGSLAQSPARAQGQAVVRWWDQFLPLEPLHQKLWDSYMAEHPEVSIDYTLLNTAEMGQALQLAFRSQQAPDVHSLAGLGVPESELVEQGWFSPIEPTFDATDPFLRNALFEGLTVFGGQTYSFPIFSSRQYQTSNWYSKSLLEGAGLDPEGSYATWDEVREAARKMTAAGNGQTFGILLPLQFAARMAVMVVELAQTAGATVTGGPDGGLNLKTGEYDYGSEPFVQALEFLLSFQKDGSLHPASSSLDARQGRARWAAGAAGIFFDGPWNIGVLQSNFPEFMPDTGVAGIPAPNSGEFHTHIGPKGGTFWVSSQSKNPEIAAEILQLFTSEEYYIGLAERMDQPPLDLDAVDKAEVHPTYREVVNNFKNTVRIAPSPVIKNPKVAQVFAEMRDIRPNLGETVQGVFSGAIRDIGAALQDYADKMTAERDRAVKVVQDKGVEVSLDDWVFADWQPGEDYTPDKYQ